MRDSAAHGRYLARLASDDRGRPVKTAPPGGILRSAELFFVNGVTSDGD